MKDTTWIWIIGGAALLYYLYQKQQAAATALPAATVQYMPGTQGIPVMPGWAGATGGR
jgi:hypothetical protein